jgi:hypothetical protein
MTHDERGAKAVRLLYPFADRDDRTAVASILSTLIREAEERGAQHAGLEKKAIAELLREAATVDCPGCEGVGSFADENWNNPDPLEACPTCHGEGRIPRELAGALDIIEASTLVGDGMSDEFRAGSNQRGHAAQIIAHEKYGKEMTSGDQ